MKRFFKSQPPQKRVGEEDEDALSEDLLDDNSLSPVEKRVKSTYSKTCGVNFYFFKH